MEGSGTNPEALPRGFMSLCNASKWADVSQKTLKRWIGRGLPVYQSGPREKILIDPHDIRNFLKKRPVSHSDLDNLVEKVFQDLKEN